MVLFCISPHLLLIVMVRWAFMIINPVVDVPSVPKPTAQQEVPSLKPAYSHQHATHESDQAGYLQRLETLDSGFTCDRAC